jgi:hypothetical protein
MTKTSLIVAALCLGISGVSMAQTGTGSTKSQPNAMKKCEGLTGAALEKCQREAAPGKSEDSASRSGGQSPGGSGDATSRTGTPPGSGGSMEKGKK